MNIPPPPPSGYSYNSSPWATTNQGLPELQWLAAAALGRHYQLSVFRQKSSVFLNGNLMANTTVVYHSVCLNRRCATPMQSKVPTENTSFLERSPWSATIGSRTGPTHWWQLFGPSQNSDTSTSMTYSELGQCIAQLMPPLGEFGEQKASGAPHMTITSEQGWGIQRQWERGGMLDLSLQSGIAYTLHFSVFNFLWQRQNFPYTNLKVIILWNAVAILVWQVVGLQDRPTECPCSVSNTKTSVKCSTKSIQRCSVRGPFFWFRDSGRIFLVDDNLECLNLITVFFKLINDHDYKTSWEEMKWKGGGFLRNESKYPTCVYLDSRSAVKSSPSTAETCIHAPQIVHPEVAWAARANLARESFELLFFF